MFFHVVSAAKVHVNDNNDKEKRKMRQMWKEKKKV